MTTTKLFVKETPADNFRLLCTVNSWSKFKDMKWWTSLLDGSTATAPVQLRAAREQMDGWKLCGPWPDAEYRIEQDGVTV